MKENLLRKPDILHSELWKSLILESISWNSLRDLKCYNSVSIEKKKISFPDSLQIVRKSMKQLHSVFKFPVRKRPCVKSKLN